MVSTMRLRRFGLALLVAGAFGCGSSDSSDPPGLEDAGSTAPLVPDFALQDVNSTSASSGQSVSPRQFMEKVSGWYFTHAS